MKITIRDEQTSDIAAIAKVTELAFLNEKNSSHTEQFIVNALRRHKQLTISLVAIENQMIIGHIAISPVKISTGLQGWYGLGPVSVLPLYQGQGVGSLLIKKAIIKLKQLGALGCVVLGNPNFYGRFGFKENSTLKLPGVSAEYFQLIAFNHEIPIGKVSYHEAFNASE